MNSNNNSQPSGNGTVSVIKTGTNTLIASITVGNSPVGIAVTPDGKCVYAANSNINKGGNNLPTGSLSVISTATNM